MSGIKTQQAAIDGDLPALKPVQKIMRWMLPKPEFGSLRILLPHGGCIDLRGSCSGPDAVMTICRWRALWRIVLFGEAGFSRGYLDGDWSAPDIFSLLDFCLLNERAFAVGESSFLTALVDRWRHSRHKNTRAGSRRNISAHYDLGNDFYRHWLDRGMSYSSAIYRDGDTLEAAQERKLDRVVEHLALTGGERTLEIGCGWGGMAERLLREQIDCVTAITLSLEQLSYARNRLSTDVASGRAELRLQDYRDVFGTFDRIVSIEMFEAVGEQYWPLYFQKLASCLSAGGCAVLQIITISPERFEKYRTQPDFIQRYIFPGGMLPTADAVINEAAKAGLQVVAQESFGASYATTLREWRRRFLMSWNEIEPLGFDRRFKRMWDYYLSYCEVGFLHGAIDVSIFKLERQL